jgi:hypothetical protein
MTPCIDHGKQGDASGYGQQAYEGRPGALMHRVAYVRRHGTTLDCITGKLVRHACDNPRCINPDHLLLGTHKDNTADMIKRGRGLYANGNMGAGELNPKAKLTREAAQSIRAAYAEGGVRQVDLATKHGITQAVVSKIIRNQLWAS